MAAALALVFFGAAAQLTDTQTESTFGQPAQYDTTLQLEREVRQIIADGRAFSQSAGHVTPL